MRRVALSALAGLMLTACDGGDPVDSVVRDVSAANHAAATQETPTGPAAQAADRAYVAAMIEQDRRAVAMADRALARSPDAGIRRMAQAVKDARTAEIDRLQAWSPARP